MSADRTPIDFGRKLRDARERRGISLRQIANATKISMAALEALERNDISRLPGGIFSRAFVRSYAVEVGLDPETTIQDFIGAFPHDSVTVGHPTSDSIEDNEALESNRRLATTFLKLVAISVPVAAVVLYFGLAGRRRAVDPSTAPTVTASGSASRGQPPAAGDPLPPPPTASPSAASSPAPGSPAPAASTDAGVPPARGAAAVPATPPARSPEAPAPPPAESRLTINLWVKRPCFVSATVDGKKAIEQLLQVGDQRTIEVKTEMVLTAGDASAIVMTLNGAEARPLGKTGEVVTARLNPANFKEYLPLR